MKTGHVEMAKISTVISHDINMHSLFLSHIAILTHDINILSVS